MKFKVGDRVVGIGVYDGKDIDGLKGRILDESDNAIECAVEFDEKIHGHSCSNRGKKGHCWWVDKDQLKLAANETIVIYRKDNDVIALNKATGERGFARCNPSDTFDFATGAKLAFERLMGIEEPKAYNGKIIFTKCAKGFTPHKIYKIVDGKITTDENEEFPILKKFKTIDDIKNYFGGKSTGGYHDSWYCNFCPSELIEVVE